MVSDETAAEVQAALVAQDPRVKISTDLARQLLNVESTLGIDAISAAIAGAGFIAVLQRRASDRIDGADVLAVAETTVVYSVAALYAGVSLGILVAVMRADSGGAMMAMLAVGSALIVAFAVGGMTLLRGTRRLYRRIEGERYLRTTRRGANRIREDGTSGYVWVGRPTG